MEVAANHMKSEEIEAIEYLLPVLMRRQHEPSSGPVLPHAHPVAAPDKEERYFIRKKQG